jgi:hypothetical protein
MRQHGTMPDNKPLYRLYDGGGKEIEYQEMLEADNHYHLCRKELI